MVFLESKYILPEDMTNAIDEYFLAYLLMVKEKKNVTEKIILSIYKDNIQIRREKDFFAFHKVDLVLL